jgi:hypothetical protein
VEQKGLFSSRAEKSERYLLQVVGEVSSRAERFPLYWGWNDLLTGGKERSWWQRDKKKSYAVERKDFLSKGKGLINKCSESFFSSQGKLFN